MFPSVTCLHGPSDACQLSLILFVSLRLLWVTFCLFVFSTFLGNYIYSLVDAKNSTDIRPLSIKPIIAGDFRGLWTYQYLRNRLYASGSSHCDRHTKILIHYTNTVELFWEMAGRKGVRHKKCFQHALFLRF